MLHNLVLFIVNWWSPCLLIQHPVQFYLLFLGFVIQKVANIFHWTKTSAMKTNELSAK